MQHKKPPAAFTDPVAVLPAMLSPQKKNPEASLHEEVWSSPIHQYLLPESIAY